MSQNLTQAPTETRQANAALLLAAGASQGDVAREVGVRRETVSKWWQSAGFRRQVRAHRNRLIEGAVGLLADASREAARNLIALATEPHGNGSVRLGACRSVLSFGHSMALEADFEERLTAIEERLGLT